MNHQLMYESIIQKAKSENRRKSLGIYYENHHIIPRCLKGSEEKINKVLLTAREHYVCHKLLTYIYPKNRKIAYAFYYMTFNKRGKFITSRDYSYAKEHLSLIPVSNKTKERISKANNGRKRSVEAKQKMRDKKLGKKLSEEHCKSMRKPHKSPGPNSIEHRNNISKTLRERGINKGVKQKRVVCKYCGKDCSPGTLSRWHNDNCKNKN